MGGPEWVFAAVVWPVALALFYAPALLYRWSVKASSLIYLPFIWIIWSSLSTSATVRERLVEILESPREQLRRWYAGVVILVLSVLPFVLFSRSQSTIVQLREIIDRSLIDYWLFTGDIAVWHVARVVKAGITIGFYWFASDALRRHCFCRAWPDGTVQSVVDMGYFVRNILACYTLVVGGYFLFFAVEWPRIHLRFFP